MKRYIVQVRAEDGTEAFLFTNKKQRDEFINDIKDYDVQYIFSLTKVEIDGNVAEELKDYRPKKEG